MNASHVIRALGISGLLLAVSACEDFSGADQTQTVQVLTEDDCYNRGGQITNHQDTNERVCVVPVQGASAGGALTPGAAAAIGGVALVTVFALADSSSGTR